ncbi:MAG: glutathione reductase (NADPH) [Myxococcota bacterium]|jgi:glutathione reductase (NADPH)
MMSDSGTYDYDFFVIGAGSGGVRAARMAAQMGVRVAVCEERYLGGTCVNVGCVPKKILVYASRYGSAIKEAHGFGWDVGSVTFDWNRLIAAKDTEIERLNGVYGRLLENAGVDLIDGRGVLTGPHSVKVGEREYTAKHILVAVGGWPFVPETEGAELGITSNEVFFMDALPKRCLVVGGGYIALEFAALLNGLGSAVEVVYRGEIVLRGFDRDIRQFTRESFITNGIKMTCSTAVTRVELRDGELLVTLDDGSTRRTDQLIWATGRKPNTANLGLESAGVEIAESGQIIVDDRFQTSTASVYALGDVSTTMQLTPVALEEAIVLVKNLFDGADLTMDYENIATAVFASPELATVGLTEAEARERFDEVDIYKSNFRPMRHTISGLPNRTMMKLIVDRTSQRVVGVHVGGEDAAEMVQSMAVALKCGVTKAQLDSTVGIHPTAAEELVTMRTRFEG